MKMSTVVLMLAAAALPAFGQAEPPARVDMDAATLGRLDALLTVCVKADSKNRASYEKYRTDLIVFGEGTPQEMRVPGSETPEFKRARAEMLEAAGKTSAEELAADCGRIIGADLAKDQD